ncbi:MAG TPA: hypothetical protein VK137_18025, partial [Planctomycetaceae bacterium]|nr:hypothetical protein [Planctomycetaceae bacterium]
MSDDLQTDRSATSRPTWEGGSDAASRFVPIADGRVARFDPAQPMSDRPGFSEETGLGSSLSGVGSLRHDEELLSQASQLVDHLRNQFSELHRRDQGLAAQMQQVEQERRGLRLWQQEAEQELQAKEDALRQREATIAGRIAEQERLTDILRLAQREVDRKRDVLDAERVRLATEMAGQLEVDRARLRQAIAAMESDQ